MKRIFMLAVMALAPGMASAADNSDLSGLGKAEVSAVETPGLPMPGAPRNNKIVGGDTAIKGEFPFLVSLQDLAGHFCGGSLIAKDWVLTAEHCVIEGVNTVVVGLHGLIEHGNEKPIDDEGRAVLAHDRLLPNLTREIDGRFHGLLRGLETSDHLHELHERHGVEEVQADDASREARG